MLGFYFNLISLKEMSLSLTCKLLTTCHQGRTPPVISQNSLNAGVIHASQFRLKRNRKSSETIRIKFSSFLNHLFTIKIVVANSWEKEIQKIFVGKTC